MTLTMLLIFFAGTVIIPGFIGYVAADRKWPLAKSLLAGGAYAAIFCALFIGATAYAHVGYNEIKKFSGVNWDKNPQRFVDTENGVVCYTFRDGISCLQTR